MKLATSGQGFIPVSDRVLASVLLALDVPLQTSLIETAGVAPLQNIYSEQHPARINGRRVHGKTNVLFATHTRDGKIRTRDIIDAWNQVASTPMNELLQHRLREYYAEPNRALVELLDMEFRWSRAS